MTKVLGLTGGIASGKSTVSGRLKAAGLPVIDADQVAREVVAAGTPGLTALVKAFGTRILRADGQLNRARLGQVVFGDSAARRRVNAITHPLIRQAIKDQITAARAAEVPWVVLDVPLLFEAGYDRWCDLVVVVWVRSRTQLRRLMARDHYQKAVAHRRIWAQMPLKQKARRADRVIDNNGSPAATAAQVKRLLASLD